MYYKSRKIEVRQLSEGVHHYLLCCFLDVRFSLDFQVVQCFDKVVQDVGVLLVLLPVGEVEQFLEGDSQALADLLELSSVLYLYRP